MIMLQSKYIEMFWGTRRTFVSFYYICVFVIQIFRKSFVISNNVGTWSNSTWKIILLSFIFFCLWALRLLQVNQFLQSSIRLLFQQVSNCSWSTKTRIIYFIMSILFRYVLNSFDFIILVIELLSLLLFWFCNILDKVINR